MLTTGVNAPSAPSASTSDSFFRAAHPAALRASLQPATPSPASSSSSPAPANAATTPTTSIANANPHPQRSTIHHRASSSSFSSVSSAPAPSSSSHHASASVATHPSPPFTTSAPMTSHCSNANRLPDPQRQSSPVRGGHPLSQEEKPGEPSPGPQQERCGGEESTQSQAQYRTPASPKLHPTYRSTQSLGGSEATSPSRIKVRDLSHIQSFASEEMLASSSSSSAGPGDYGQRGQEASRQYEISSMPITDIIEMVAGLLTKITTTNDEQHEHVHRHVPHPDNTANLSPQSTSVLAFHGKNVPAITILSYLCRIHKYCPTTYEVFLSLLVYFDRMTEMVNKGFPRSLKRQQSGEQKHQHQHQHQHQRPATSSASSPDSATSTASTSTPRGHSSQSSIVTPPSSGCVDGRTHDPALPSPTSPSSSSHSSATVHANCPTAPSPRSVPSQDALHDPANITPYFVVDSYNIHRLIIAGVTCASKFFSDVFYTNSRYAKVGGLPLVELNHLELQFLVLNDFRLSIPVEELEAYGTMLVEFYAREVVAQQKQHDEEESKRQRQEAEAQAQAAAMSSGTGRHSRGGSREDVTMRYRAGSTTA